MSGKTAVRTSSLELFTALTPSNALTGFFPCVQGWPRRKWRHGHTWTIAVWRFITMDRLDWQRASRCWRRQPIRSHRSSRIPARCPLFSKMANYQLMSGVNWLRSSQYCGAFMAVDSKAFG